MPPVLTPEERGPLAWWAYDSRDRLGLSDVQVAAALPGPRRGEKYNPATIRKAETQDRHMSRPLWRQLTTYYTELAREKGIALDPVPGKATNAPPADQSDLADAIRDQTKAITDLVTLLRPLVDSHDQRLNDLAQVVGGLTERALRADPKPPVLDGTAG